MSDYSIGELIEIYTAHYSNYKGVNDQKRAMCQTFLKDLRIVNKRIKQLEELVKDYWNLVDALNVKNIVKDGIFDDLHKRTQKALEGK